MLIDNFNRRIDYLRISVTDRCNLRCIYCMGPEGIINKPQPQILTFEEILKLTSVFASLGITKVRLTGGEPLLRRGVVELIKALAIIKALEDISLSTNGILLKEYASSLKKAGLRRLNISLDSLNFARYKFITRGGNLDAVKEGIKEAIEVGFSLIKINVLLLDGINEDEIFEFLSLTRENYLHIRFLEFMPLNPALSENIKTIFCGEVLEIASKIGPVEPEALYGNGPAKAFRIKHALGSFGLISPMSDKFCCNCNRLRLTSDGRLLSCLHHEAKVNLREPLRRNASEEEIIRLIKLAVANKPYEHSIDTDLSAGFQHSMCQIGG